MDNGPNPSNGLVTGTSRLRQSTEVNHRCLSTFYYVVVAKSGLRSLGCSTHCQRRAAQNEGYNTLPLLLHQN